MIWLVVLLSIGLLATSAGLILTNAYTKDLAKKLDLVGRELDAQRDIAMMHHKWLRGINKHLGAKEDS